MAALLVGVMVAVQSRINGALALRLDNGLQAAVISFGTGLIILCVLVATVAPVRRGALALRPAVRHGHLPWWCLIGGFGGATLVAVQALVVPTIGVALFIVSVIAGQTINSLNVDRIGLGPAGRTPITTRRVLAAGIALLAVIISVSDKLGSATFSLVAVLGGVVAGAAIAAQQAVNGRVSVAVKQPVTAAWVNFIVGTAALVVALLIRTLVGGPSWSTGVQPWWLYLGGPIGVVFIATAALVVGRLGVLLFGLCSVAGQVLGALGLDLLVPTPTGAVTAATVIGAAIALVAVLVGAGVLRLGRRRHR